MASGDAHVSRYVFEDAFTSLPGCFGNKEVLVATSPALQVAQPSHFAVDSAFDTGWSFLAVGVDGTDAGGCGLFVAGVGELLLAPSVGPFVVDDGPIVGNAASLSFVDTTGVTLIGVEFAFQAVNVGFVPGAPLATSNAVVAELRP